MKDSLKDEVTCSAIGAAQGTATVVATGTSRFNFGVPHLLSAKLLSRHVVEIEKAHAGAPFGDFWEEILAFATASVMTSVAGLEAYANEVFIDGAELFPEMPKVALEELWPLLEQKSPLDKLQSALRLRNVTPFETGSNPCQDVIVLVRLRNSLVHFKAEWFDQQTEHLKLSKALKFLATASQFLPDEPLFPRAWASGGTADWAVNSVAKLLFQFEERMGIMRATKIRGRLGL